MEEKPEVHLRQVMLLYFKKGKNASQTARKICDEYGPKTVSEITVQRWFQRFKGGNFNLEDDAPSKAVPSEQPSTVDPKESKAVDPQNGYWRPCSIKNYESAQGIFGRGLPKEWFDEHVTPSGRIYSVSDGREYVVPRLPSRFYRW